MATKPEFPSFEKPRPLGESAKKARSLTRGISAGCYGTPGSVRPDFVAADGSASFEVKNYNIAKNSSELINNIAKQAVQRQINFPAGMEQQVVIDIRGQIVTPGQRSAIVQGIVKKSNGIIGSIDIQFKTK
ncbi:hypothetical protein GIY62_17295 [Burkholderia plantarii]|uniref:hypothetical protein n=1 Tax=Burkholderia plantarii TaxID=41899 RepID=UPI00272AB77F|nr:hypothetical protein [Burkholderia plantarii]WLE58841.1 hypothetical protein GIY62_17295 [Burkholderia plantarii]